ncbi:vWA domain-containing protein [Pseudoalteromonas tunicata]|jgi:Ca-activated chloride channel family protein|uniref:VWFA domain-containing protein n=1 Tax=Pseudoalteromonas tunicata D2 TaxID=87626 RepID=A4C688_9GAMM|nr:VWA domain-containing protein [Pseudoalteromonas tunicata]ATC95466.1 Ca-activated chloride channel protein [Pseudoalteromonas tunicata]AXT31041.1 VWA domain-containing protein [Pseudoalteromonas tunicata]EAR29492.1 hypothetical protein PTD2_11769 [Pseudoalteromonas tunicata D2]
MTFEFIRPDYLWLLVAVLPLALALYFQKQHHSRKQPLIAPHLAQFILAEQPKTHRQSPWLLIVFITLAIVALAGPSWQQQQIPIYQAKQARVIVMDMSLSMYSTDIKPNRLSQARFKALDMIELFKEGETALVAYAADAYVISPLTSDASTLSNLIPSLSPDIMPTKGSNVMAGLTTANELLSQAGYLSGDIILVTDGIDSEDLSSVQEFALQSGHHLHVYAVATEQGAPIELPQGGFLKDNYGQIVVPKAQFTTLKQLAKRGSGQFASYSASNEDINQFNQSKGEETLSQSEQNHTLARLDGGVYLMLFLLPLALLLLKRNQVLSICFVVLLLPTEKSFALDWQNLWQNEEQKALQAYQQGDFKQASQADTPQLKGAALYKQGEYEQALAEFSQDNSAQGLYNQANALAQLGKLPDAIEKYQAALNLDTSFNAAKENKELLEKLLKDQQQQQNPEQSEQNNSDQNQQDKQDSQQSEQQNSDQKNSEQQNSEQQSDESKQSEQKSDQQQSEDGQQSEQQKNSDEKNQPEMQAKTQEEQAKQQAQEQSDEKSDDSAQKQMQVQQDDDQKDASDENKQGQQMEVTPTPLSAEEREKAQQLSQLLRKVPDDPSILLRNKMQLEYQNRGRNQSPQGVKKSW